MSCLHERSTHKSKHRASYIVVYTPVMRAVEGNSTCRSFTQWGFVKIQIDSVDLYIWRWHYLCLPYAVKSQVYANAQQATMSGQEENVTCFSASFRGPICGGQAFFLHLSLLSAVKWKIRENPRQFIHLPSDGETVLERKTPYHTLLILRVQIDLCLFKKIWAIPPCLPSPKCEWQQSATHSAVALF